MKNSHLLNSNDRYLNGYLKKYLANYAETKVDDLIEGILANLHHRPFILRLVVVLLVLFVSADQMIALELDVFLLLTEMTVVSLSYKNDVCSKYIFNSNQTVL